MQVGDGGGSLTIDGTVAVSSITTAIVPGTGATNLGKAEDAAHTHGDVGVMALTVRQDTAAALSGTDADYQPLITDASGRLHVNVGNTVTVASHAVTNAGTFAVQVDGSALTALQLIDDVVLAEDAAHNSGDKGVMSLVVRKDSGTALASTDGDYSPLQVDSSGNLRVNVAAGSTAGTEYTEDAASASDPAGGMLILRRRDSLSGSEVSTDGDNIAANATAKGELYVKHTDAIPVTDNGGSLTVDGSITANAGTNLNTSALALESGGNLAAIASAVGTEDAASADGHTGMKMLAVRQDTPTNTGGDGDYEFLKQSGGRLWVDASGKTLTVASHAVTNAGTFAVQVDGSALTALQLIDDVVYTDDAAFTPGTSKVAAVGLQADETSTDSIDEGDIGCPRMTLDRKAIVTTQPHAAGGLSIFRSLDIDETEEEIKGTAGCVYGMWVTNTATSTRWIKFYNATAANVTVGTTTPVITWGIPGNSSDDVSGLFGSGNGIFFDTAISVAATTGVADNDTGAPAANDVIINVFYK